MSTPGFTAEASIGVVRGGGRERMRSMPRRGVQPAQGVPVYGNWCGPGHGGGAPPIDPVDRVCCQHDRCYGDRGTLDCSCDRDLVARMPGAIADGRTSAAGRAAGSAASALFAISPCLCHRICLPFIGCTGSPPVPGIGKFCPPPFA
jgi:hypothetical protein